MMRFVVPLVVFGVLVGFFYVGLHLNPREVPSPFINKPAPDFKLSQLQDFQAQFSPKDNLGKVWLLNVWASWCVACRQEHPLLVQMSKTGTVPIYGLNYKDQPDDAKRWLAQFGDPYKFSLVDFDGRVGIDYGVYGVPETFVVDKQGVIRHKVIGPVTPKILSECLSPLTQLLNAEVATDAPEMKKVLKACA
jgi:cytochrome c biogenesis protein CcmG/thiol:disulfide interchange protein DsbE